MQQRTAAFGGTLLKKNVQYRFEAYFYVFFCILGPGPFWGSFFNAGTKCRFRTISFCTIKQYNTVLNKKTVQYRFVSGRREHVKLTLTPK